MRKLEGQEMNVMQERKYCKKENHGIYYSGFHLDSI